MEYVVKLLSTDIWVWKLANMYHYLLLLLLLLLHNYYVQEL